MNKTEFFDSLKSTSLFKKMSQRQVDGVNAILSEARNAGATLEQAAYMLATGYGETGGKMQAVRENLNYAASTVAKHFKSHRRQGKSAASLARNPKLLGNTVYGGEWGRKNLGNVKPNDGYDFRGWGLGQWTGRRNTEKAGKDVGMDLVSDPSKLDDINVNAKLLVLWMLKGKATGLKLGDYIDNSKKDYLGARKVWGGVDAKKYVGYAKEFEIALSNAEYTPYKPSIPQVAKESAEETVGWLGAIFRMLGWIK